MVSEMPVECTTSANSSYSPCGNIRELLFERAVAGFARVEMPEAIERRRQDEQMHQVAVIGDQVVRPAQGNPSGIAQRQRQTSVGRHRG